MSLHFYKMNRGRKMDFACLPKDILFEVFSYLSTDDMNRAGSVCKRWFEVAKDPMMWIKVDARVKDSTRVVKLIKRLPRCVTSLKISCSSRDLRFPLWLPDVMSALRSRCPDLDIFIIENTFFQVQPCDVRIRAQERKKFHQAINFLLVESVDEEALQPFCASCASEDNKDQFAPEHLPEKLRVISLRDSLYITSYFASRLDVFIPQVKVLDLSPSLCLTEDIVPFFSRLTNLEELYLARCPVTSEGIEKLLQIVKKLKVLDLENTGVCSKTFLALQRYGSSLKELYVGGTLVEDSFFTFESINSFENLQVLCLRRTCVTPRGVEELLDLYPRLRSVNISKCNTDKIWTRERYFYMHSKLTFNEIHCDHFRKNIYCK